MLTNNFLERIKTNFFSEFNKKKICSNNKMFFKDNNIVQPEALINSSKKLWSAKQKLSLSNQIFFSINHVQSKQNDFVQVTKNLEFE